MKVRYAVVSVDRRDGLATTVEVHGDTMEAQIQANRLNQRYPSHRYTVVPFEVERKDVTNE